MKKVLAIGLGIALSFGVASAQNKKAPARKKPAATKKNPKTDPKPAVLLEYGTHDELFPFERVALPMRATLEGMGYSVEFRVDQGGRHWPSGTFHAEALDWFQSEPWRERS